MCFLTRLVFPISGDCRGGAPSPPSWRGAPSIMNLLPGSDICVFYQWDCRGGAPSPPPGGPPPSLVFSHRFWSDTGRRCVGKYQDFGHLVLLMVYFYIFLYH
jgi:hypothetical protein